MYIYTYNESIRTRKWESGIAQIIREKFLRFSGCFPRGLFMHPKFTAFSGKKINVFNLKLTRRFTLLIFCFHAAELLFSISSVYWIHVFLVKERDTAGTVRGPFVQFWARGRGILL